MKHNYSAWRYLDAGTPEEKGGGQGAIIKAIDESFKKTTEQMEAVKTSHQKALDDTKTELQNEISAAKGTAQKALDAVEEARKELAAVKNVRSAETEVKSFDQRVKEAVEEKADDIAKFHKGEIKKITLDIKGVDQKAVAAVSVANVTGTTHWGAQSRPGIIMDPSTSTHMRSLIPVSPSGPGTDYYFMKENGAGEGAPAPTAEGGTKPQFDVDLVESSVKFETIAGWLLMSRKAMNNIPGFVSYLQRRLPTKLMDVEDAQILYGNGTSPNLKGILTAGNFVAGSAAGTTPLAEKIINDLSLLEDTYKRIANGIALRPADYYNFFKAKASGSGEYDLPEGFTFVNGVLYILGVPVAKTTALTAGDYVVGDFINGAELLVQESMRIEFFEQDSTNVRTNQVTVRIEETVALPVYGSNYFVKGSSLLA
jgi:HK97 family phage major capsid protein